MYYFIAALFLFAIIALFYKLILPVNEPDFSLMGIQSDENLRLSVMNLAGESKKFKEHGKGLSTRLISGKVKKAFKIIKKKVDNNQVCYDFENWIYDNFYKINTAIAKQKKLLLSYSRLPHVGELPRIYDFLSLVVKASGGAYTKSQFKELAASYCAVSPLTFGEINSIKGILEYCLLEYIAIFCSKAIVIDVKTNRARKDAERGRVNISEINFNSYVLGMERFASIKLKRGLNDICLNNGLGIRERSDNFFRLISTYAGYVGAAITNLHSLVKFDDNYIIELSPLYKLFMQEPKINFADCTLATRYVYLYNIDRVAKKKRINELAYARTLIDKSEEQNIDIAEFILPKKHSKKIMRLYIFTILLLSIFVNFLIAFFVMSHIWWVFFFTFPIVFGFMQIITHDFFGVIVKRRYLPRKKIDKNEQKKCKTMILFSQLIANINEAKDIFEHLETIRYANNEEIFSYGVLIDFTSGSSAEFNEQEQEIVSFCKKKYEALKDKDRYNIFIRKKSLISGGSKYQGWEKKRGALLDLNSLILFGDENKFHTILGRSYFVKYVLTLDSDTLLNCAQELVEIMEHPYNFTKNVVSISIGTNPASANKTLFSSFMSGAVGFGSYSDLGHDVNFDIFGHGNYTGKGIYRVKEFHDNVSDKFMDNRVLSHDFIEGAMAGCANVPEKALDSFPPDFSSYVMRQQRWLRGDWQLLPYLFRKIKNKDGRKIVNPIAPIDKWHIFCNLFSSLIPIVSLVLIYISIFFEPHLLLLCIAFSLNVIYIINALRISTLLNIKSAVLEFLRQIYNISCLPVIAIYSLYSILITLTRLIRKKKLLEWKVFAHSKGRVSFFANIITSIIIITISLFFNLNFVFYAVSIIFLSVPIVDRIISKEKKVHLKNIISREMLKNIAFKTWRYFEKQFDESSLLLPADNYQDYLNLGYTPRTSPTNIGMALTSICAVRELGFIDDDILNGYIERIVDSIEKAEKWQGNLYNWIDTATLVSLSPRYVSTVDSGNLLTGLLLSTSYVTHNNLNKRIERLIDETRIEKLFDEKRGLFLIGYNDTDKKFDENHYDLMASESSLTYLISIGLGKINKTAWSNLSRRHVKYGGKLLYSWTGGLFEYLMPSIYFDYPKRGMLEISAKNAINANIKYAKKIKHGFWGISESQYNNIDNNGLYQYKAFGVPHIAHANLAAKKVFTPYASFLALTFFPKKTAVNIKKMADTEMLDEQGFFESIDDGEIVRSYMTHHQGMILGSIANYLTSGGIINKMKKIAPVRAAELLVTLPPDTQFAKRKIRPLKSIIKTVEETETVNQHYLIPKLNLLTGGRYSIVIDEQGRGYSLYDDIYISRCDENCGMELFLMIDGKRINLLDGLNCEQNFFSSKYYKNTEKITSIIDAFVLPNASGEVRDIQIKNVSDKSLDLSLFSYMELSLAGKDDYIAHKAYSNIFLYSEYDSKGDFLLINRRGKNYPFIAHYFSVKNVDYSASRADFFDRAKNKFRNGHLLDTVASGKLTKRLKPLEDLKVQVFTLVSYDLAYLKRQVKITRSEGYLKRIGGECFSISKRLNPCLAIKKVASILLFDPIPVSKRLAQIGVNIDIPLVLLPIDGVNSLQRLKVQLESMIKLYRFDINFNIVVLFDENSGYFKSLKESLNSLLDEIGIMNRKNRKSTVILINKNEATNSLIEDLMMSATDINNENVEALTYDFRSKPAIYPNAELIAPTIDLPMGIGGFLCDGSYFMDITEVNTPAPWSNIIANEFFGTIITESGGGYTYSENSRENKLTSWSNDFLADHPSESIVLQEGSTVWSITKKPIKAGGNYHVIHSFGYSEFSNNYNGIICREKQYISGTTKFFDIQAENKSNNERIINFAAIFEAVLGTNLNNTAVRLEFSVDENTLIVTNTLSGKRFFIQSNYKLEEYAFYRECFSDSNDNINRAMGFGRSGRKKCAAYSIRAYIKPQNSIRVIFSIGTEKDVNFSKCDSYFNRAVSYYSKLSSFSITIGNKELDNLLKWLPYQILCSRFFAKSGFYQAGGAKGFRDQLQDCLGMLYINPQLVRSHILCAAAHQFEDGDVQHWWHEPAVGVRTKISDDKLFLPYVTAEYIRFTGDYEILSERIPYLKNIHIPSNEAGVYAAAEQSEKSESIQHHCISAINSALRFGKNGLMLMGGGDWNDAMDEIGAGGKGTTVWGSMFLYYVIDKFLPFISDIDEKHKLMSVREGLREAVDCAWDGEWFLRAFTDDGREVGGKKCRECKIDLITQSWSKISNITTCDKYELALYSAAKKLIDTENGIIKLLSPPFKETKGIGYISNYPAGVRENGGQYTHGAIWYIISLFEAGNIRLAYDLINMINPINHSKTQQDAQKYSVEPYVLAADVYAGEHAGKGGWTWYTGAASWMYKCILENLLGIKITKNIIVIDPLLPKDIKNVSVEIRTALGKINIEIENSDDGDRWFAQIGNIKYNSSAITVCESIIGKTVKIKKH